MEGGDEPTSCCDIVAVAGLLHIPDNEPDAGEPVSHQGEHCHDQCEYHSAVLGVPETSKGNLTNGITTFTNNLPFHLLH